MIGSKNHYYPSIDGLRSLAVIAVIINHFGKSWLPSGYLGVDIFFVISGFVITSALSNKKGVKLSSFLRDFYSKRIKRLFPALALCVLITSFFISFFNPSPWAHLVTGLASLFGVSNIELYLNATNYWGQSASLNPFTHTCHLVSKSSSIWRSPYWCG